MKITIITANYNRVDEIQNLYNSIKKQTHKDWEWIICDDHSTMSNFLNVKKLLCEDDRVKLIRNQENRKQAYSRNRCIKLAKGDIITNIDSDDDIPENRLEIINDSFTREKEGDIVYGGWTLVSGDKQMYFPPNPFKPREFFIENRINNNAAAWKRSLNLFYDEDYPICADDYSMWMSAIARGLNFMVADINMVFWKQEKGCQGVDKNEEMAREAKHIREFWKKPKVSILMPTYNRTKYLKQAIQSVMDQTFTNWELLVIDDGSKFLTRNVYPKDYDALRDGPVDKVEEYNPVKEIVDSFKDARIKYLRKENGGLSDALNYGLERSQGDYIAMLDDDDVWLEFHLKMLYKIIKKGKEGVVYGQTGVGAILEDNDTIEVHKEDLCHSFENNKNKLACFNHLTTCSVMFDKSIIFKYGLFFDETLNTHMDWDFWIKLTKYTKFSFINIKSSVYRMHNNNMLAPSNNKIVGVTKLSSWNDAGKVQMKHLNL